MYLPAIFLPSEFVGDIRVENRNGRQMSSSLNSWSRKRIEIYDLLLS